MTTERLLLALTLLALHFVASYYYYTYSFSSVADSYSYYYYASSMRSGQSFGLSTALVANIVLLLKRNFAASYLECFFFFQSFGFAGIMIMARVFTEIEERVGAPERRGYLVLLFLPSVNFWTAAIGKDAPLFFAISLSVWAMLKLRKRFVQFCIALAVMVLFRAHIALMAASALAGAAFFGSGISVGRKAGLLALALTGAWFATGAVQSTLGVDATSFSSVSSFLDKQNGIYATVAGTTSLGGAPLYVRAFSLFFRPFFFDANGIMGVVASAENVGVAAAMLYCLIRWRDIAHLARRVLFIRYVLLFAAFILFSLMLVYYNVGLGLRQRVMAFPMIFSILIALWSMRRKMAGSAVPQMRTGLIAPADGNTVVSGL
jgi:hypothetical protein